MYKIAVLDDDEHWCLTVQRFLRKQFEVSIFTDIKSFMRAKDEFDLIIIDFTILPMGEFEAIVNGCELIRHLKQTLKRQPLMVLASGYISGSELEDANLSQTLCAEADIFLAKDAGLEAVLQLVQRLLPNDSCSAPSADSSC